MQGALWLFLETTIVALQHEYAHAVVASQKGLRFRKVTLMPYGAVLDGAFDGVSPKDEVQIALAGPICNLLTASAFVAVWWLFPDVYAYTDTACFVSVSLAVVNLLPAFPLDGGRVLRALSERFLVGRGVPPTTARRKARTVSTVVTLCVSAILLVFAVCLRVRGQNNPTLPIFALFLAVGALTPSSKPVYERLSFPKKQRKNGLEIKRVLVDEQTTVLRASRFFERGKYVVFEVETADGEVCFIREDDLINALASVPFTTPIIKIKPT